MSANRTDRDNPEWRKKDFDRAMTASEVHGNAIATTLTRGHAKAEQCHVSRAFITLISHGAAATQGVERGLFAKNESRTIPPNDLFVAPVALSRTVRGQRRSTWGRG